MQLRSRPRFKPENLQNINSWALQLQDVQLARKRRDNLCRRFGMVYISRRLSQARHKSEKQADVCVLCRKWTSWIVMSRPPQLVLFFGRGRGVKIPMLWPRNGDRSRGEYETTKQYFPPRSAQRHISFLSAERLWNVSCVAAISICLAHLSLKGTFSNEKTAKNHSPSFVLSFLCYHSFSFCSSVLIFVSSDRRWGLSAAS
jgi:hypothetical protein